MSEARSQRPTIGGLEVLSRLSVGGMGEIFLARRHGALGFSKLVALKVIRKDLVEDDLIRKMFLDEARLLSQVTHPAVAQVHEFGEEQGLLFFSMEYVPGVPLAKLHHERKGPFPPAIVARIGAEVCRGLHAVHQLEDLDGKPLNVVHRDISPQNLMLTFDGKIKIIDFGVAFMTGRRAAATLSGMIKGKLSYMSPEQVLGNAVDRRSDLYSLSIVLHELLTGQLLFGERNLSLADAIKRPEVSPPSLASSAVPVELDHLVMQGLSGEPEARFASARQMAVGLEAIIEQIGGETIEEFAERELQGKREAHRSYLQRATSEPNGTLVLEDVVVEDAVSGSSGPPPIPESIATSDVILLSSPTSSEEPALPVTRKPRAARRAALLLAAGLALVAAFALNQDQLFRWVDERVRFAPAVEPALGAAALGSAHRDGVVGGPAVAAAFEDAGRAQIGVAGPEDAAVVATNSLFDPDGATSASPRSGTDTARAPLNAAVMADDPKAALDAGPPLVAVFSEVAASGDEAAASGDEEAIPGDEVAASGDEAAASGDEEVIPGDEVVASGDEAATAEEASPPERVAQAPPAGRGSSKRAVGQTSKKRRKPKRATNAQVRSTTKRSKSASKATARKKRGYLSVITRPGGTIYIGGKKLGTTPLRRASVPPGRHMVALRRPHDRKPRWRSWVRVRPGRHVRIDLR